MLAKFFWAVGMLLLEVALAAYLSATIECREFGRMTRRLREHRPSCTVASAQNQMTAQGVLGSRGREWVDRTPELRRRDFADLGWCHQHWSPLVTDWI